MSWAATEGCRLDMCVYGNAAHCCFISSRYDQGRDSSQQYLNDYEDNPSRDSEEVSSYYLGTLESSKNSGLSSSSYELSQYMNGNEHSEPGHASDAGELGISSERGPVHRTSAPLKFSIPHAVVSFGPAGQLIRVAPGLSTQESVSQLEIHSLEVGSNTSLIRFSSQDCKRWFLVFMSPQVILSETKEQQEMRSFPGPLTRYGFVICCTILNHQHLHKRTDAISPTIRIHSAECQIWSYY